MPTAIERPFPECGRQVGSVFVLPPRDAIRMVEHCLANGIEVLGVEGFPVATKSECKTGVEVCEMGDSEPALVTFTRPWQPFNLLTDYEIFLNGELLAVLRNGRTIDAKIPPGDHEILARIGWCYARPLPISAEPGVEIRLTIRNRIPRWFLLFPWILFLYVLVPYRYIEVKLAPPHEAKPKRKSPDPFDEDLA